MKKRILIIVYVLLLCVTTSFAWLSNVQENKNDTVDVNFADGKAVITDFAFDAYLEKRNDDGTYSKVEGAFEFDQRTMVPGVRVPFKIKIKNIGDNAKNTKLVLDMHIDNFDVNEPSILDMLYIDMVLGKGFADSGTRNIFIKLSEANVVGNEGSGDFSLDLYGEGEELTIPIQSIVDEINPGADGYVTLDCSFYYDQNATAEYQNKAISAMSFRLE